ncbi:MAG: phage tail protein [Alphaproteobacteria bacterium]|nr:phage tail protein [Alphaproteobacteria bacterium]MCB9931162.1 phage tail protein [Alphaproteobacteria bacterium]
MALNPYPLPAFHFKVTILDTNKSDTAFQEVDGLASKIDVEEVGEGGENNFKHHLPKGISHPNLVLKRGVTVIGSPLVTWCKSVLEGGFAKAIQPKTVQVSLLNAAGGPDRFWNIANAYPVAWTVEAFNSTKNEVALERIELAYTEIKRMF